MEIKRKMSNRDFIVLVYLCTVENGHPDDLDENFKEYEDDSLNEVLPRYYKVPAGKEEVARRFTASLCKSLSYKTLLEGLKKKKKPYSPSAQVLQIQQGIKVDNPVDIQPASNNIEQAVEVEVEIDDDGISMEERWEWAKSEREIPVFEEFAPYNSDRKQYLFVKNLNKPVAYADNIHWDIVFYMLEHRNLSFEEVHRLIITDTPQMNARYQDREPSSFPKVPERYHKEMCMRHALEAAEQRGKIYYEVMNEPEPPIDETLERYRRYIINYGERDRSVVPSLYDCSREYDKIKSIKDDTVTLIYDAEDDEDEEHNLKILKYASYNALMSDIIRMIDSPNNFKEQADMDAIYNVFGKTITPRKYIADMFKKYPHGFSDKPKFYITRREAFEDGKL